MKNKFKLNRRLFIFLTFFLIFNGLLFGSFKPFAEITISGEGENTTLNFFYDNSIDGYPFDDAHMTPDISLQGGGIQKFVIPVPLEKLNKLRIDFGTVPKSFEIHSLSIVKSPVYEIKVSGEEFLKRFSNTNDISEYTVKDGIVRIHTSGTDGHIYSLDLLSNPTLTFRQDFFQKEFFFVTVSVLLVFIDKILLLIKKSVFSMNRKVFMLIRVPNFYQLCIICIFLLALLLRIIVTDTTRELRPGSDELVYHYAAENLLRYSTLTYDRDGSMFNNPKDVHPTTVLSPGYPVYIAIIYALFQHSTQAVLISHLVLSMVCFWLMYKMLNMLNINKTYVAIALLFAAVYPGFLYNIERMLTEQLFTTLLLAFVYSFLIGMQRNSIVLIGISAAFLTSATHVRALAFPLLLLAFFFLIVYERKNKKNILKNIAVFVGIVFLFMLPWWVRNWITFDSFMLFSAAGENPKIWGAVPYFIDMASTYNQSLNAVLQNNMSSNPSVYYKWRIFGFFQYMWGDLWDENLVHPYPFLRPFLVLQHLLVVPCLAAIPFIIKKCRKEIIFISCIPLAYTLMNMPFHGLPRYVYPSVPFIFILAGVFLDKIGSTLFQKKDKLLVEETHLYKWQSIINLWMRRCYFVFAFLFSIILSYSVYIFAYGMNGEMSEYRLSRYMGISLKSLQAVISHILCR